ncbi:MAG: DMT family transporter [Sulfitobacter sp.]|nr:DMT family transporter [Sulfitobacter sp.]MCP4084489.1 DMT family transporter [Actinomycetes bacterium]
MGDTAPADRSHLGYGAAIAALVFWGAQAVIAKGIDIDPLPLVFLRIWMAVVFSIGVLHISGSRLDRRVLRYSLIGGVAFGLDLVFFFTSIKLTTVANATIIPSMQPVLLIFAAPILFHERVSRNDIGWAGVAIVGVALVVFGASGLPEWSPAGDLWAVATLFAWTSYFMASKAARAHLSAAEFTAGASLVAAIVVTPFAAFSGQAWVMPTAGEWFWIAMMAVGPGWAGHFLMNWALGHVPIWFGGTVALAAPVASAIMAAVFLGENVTGVQATGMFVTVGSLAYITLRSQTVPVPQTKPA